MVLSRELILTGAWQLTQDVERALGLGCAVLPEPGVLLGSSAARVDPARWVGLAVAASPQIAAGVEVGEFDTEASHVAHRLAVLIQEDLCLRTGRIWPAGADGPLVPSPLGWATGGAVVVEYGWVRDAAERVPLPDGTVRWWVDDPGWGVIASDEGDVAFTYSELGNPLRDVEKLPGRTVDYTVTGRARGVYRAAATVTRG